MSERFNAVANAGSFNCPICFRAKSLVQSQRNLSLWRCQGYTDDSGGCWTKFQLIAVPGEVPTLERVREDAPARQTVEDRAAKRQRFVS